MSTLYLRAEEKKAFDALPAALREGWQVEKEVEGGDETDEQLVMRYHMSSLGKHPFVQKMVKQVEEGADLEDLSMRDLPSEMAPDFFFTLGARGLSAFMNILLEHAKTDEDLQHLAHFSHVRRELIQTNLLPV